MPVSIALRDDRSEKIPYDSPDYPIYIFREFLSNYPNYYTAPSHWHDDIELIAVLDGEMDYNVNGEIARLEKGAGIFVNAGQMHFGFSGSGTECDFICAILHPMLLCASAAYEREFVLPVIRSVPYMVLDPGTLWQRAVLEQIYRLFQSKGQRAGAMKAQSAFAAVWSLLYENLPLQETESPGGSDLTAARNMVGFIQKNYAQKISLREIAASGAVGQSKCCKLFAQYFGQPPNAYLNQYRLNKSLELLRCGGRPVTEVALSAGFGSASYFAELFRKTFGESPTEYRKRQ